MPDGDGATAEGPIFITVAESFLTIQHNTLSVFNVIIKNSDSTVSLIRYPFDLLEFHQKIRQYYPKVKISFPSLTNPSRKQILQLQGQAGRQTQQQPQQHFSSSSLSTSITAAKTKKRRSLRDLLILPFNKKKKKKTNTDKVEKYLLQCFQHPIVGISSVLRDFTSVQREEDAILTSYHTSTTLTPTINNSGQQQQSLSIANKKKESSIVMPNHSLISQIVSKSPQSYNEQDLGIDEETSIGQALVQSQDSHYDPAQYPTVTTYPTMTANKSSPTTSKNIQELPTTANTTSFSASFGLDNLELVRVLGKGCMGKVFLVKLKEKTDHRQLYALKCIKKKWVIQQKEVAHTKTERDILLLLRKQQLLNTAQSDSTFFAQLKQLFQTSSCLFFLLDYYPGGDLATQLSLHSSFSPDRARFYTAEIIQGLEVLHQNNIIYRDLKPENVLIGRDGHIVLTDFGLSKLFTPTMTIPDATKDRTLSEVTALDDQDGPYYYDDDNVLTTRTFCGTAEYLAPEVLIGEPYTFVIDFWSLGTLLYEMLAGTTPFWAEKHMDMYRRVLEEPLTFPPKFDRDTRNFLTGLLEKEPHERLGWGEHGIEDIKTDPYFDTINWDMVQQRQLSPPYIPTIASEEDVSNFDEVFTSMPARISDASLLRGSSAATDLKASTEEDDPFKDFSTCSLTHFDQVPNFSAIADNEGHGYQEATASTNISSYVPSDDDYNKNRNDNNLRKRHNNSSTIKPIANYDEGARALKRRQTDNDLNKLYSDKNNNGTSKQRQQLPCILKRSSNSSSAYSISSMSNSIAVVDVSQPETRSTPQDVTSTHPQHNTRRAAGIRTSPYYFYF